MKKFKLFPLFVSLGITTAVLFTTVGEKPSDVLNDPQVYDQPKLKVKSKNNKF